MHTNNFQVTYNAWTIPALCKHNHYLMDNFKDNGFPQFKLLWLKACCMYLHVATMAEIMDHTGKKLLPQILTSHNSHIPKGLSNISTSWLQWLQVYLPSQACWRLWSNTICTIYTGSRQGIQLQQPLGVWTMQHKTTWCLHDPAHLVYQQHATLDTRVAQSTLHWWGHSWSSPQPF